MLTKHDVWRSSVVWAKMSVTGVELENMRARLAKGLLPLYPTAREQAAIEILARRG